MKKNFFIEILVLMCIAFLLHGCSRLNKSTESDGIFPASIGNFKRDMIYNEKENNYINEKNKDQKYKSRDAKYSDGDDNVFYGISTHQKAEDAINEQEKEASYGNNTVWKTADLKDKSGKTVGKITICRMNDSSPDSPNAANGGFNYSVGFNINNQNYHAALTNSSHNWTPQTTDKFVNFVKALTAASQVDLSILDLITTSFAGKTVTADKLSAISPPVKIAAAAYLKGKTAVFSKSESLESVATDEYIENSDRRADLMEEVGSIVKIECSKSSSIGQYSTDTGTKIPAFSSLCNVTIIDNTIPAVIAKKTFTNSETAKNITVKTDKNGKLNNYDKEFVAPAPRREIADFLQKLPQK